MQLDDRLPFPVPDAVLNQSAHEPWCDREKLTGHACFGDLRLDLVGDFVELPAERIGDHRDGLGEPYVPDAAVLDLLLEFFARQARADLLLERQAPGGRGSPSLNSCLG